MIRQSISFTSPNEEWLKAQVESEEYASKSDAINDLIRKERLREQEREMIRTKLIAAEHIGFVTQTSEEILAEFKAGINSGDV